MSTWTHVAAVFRIDGLKVDDFYRDFYGARINGRVRPRWDEVTGRAIYDCDVLTDDSYELRRNADDWKLYDEHPEQFMPTGSEGSLQRLVWENPDKSRAASYTVTVFGDLRDYNDQQAIHDWFDGVCEKCIIRQAVCNCEVGGTSYTWEWEE